MPTGLKSSVTHRTVPSGRLMSFTWTERRLKPPPRRLAYCRSYYHLYEDDGQTDFGSVPSLCQHTATAGAGLVASLDAVRLTGDGGLPWYVAIDTSLRARSPASPRQ